MNMLRVSNVTGVPLIVPLAVSNTRPAGRLGLIVQDTTAPEPLTVGISGKSVLTVLLIKFNSLTVKSISGITSITVIITEVVSLPPELVAVTV
jgi:hypothetical protein